MDFSISPDTQQFLDQAREFVEQELIPLESQLLGQSWYEIEPLLKEKREQVKKLGLWAPNLPADVGGRDLPLTDLGLLSEVLGRTPTGHYVFGCQAPDAGNAELLHKYASDEQKQQYLEPLAQGDIRSCFAMTEKHRSGANPTLLAATAEKDGDDYVLNGLKWFTTACDGSELTIAMMVTNPDSPPHMRASMIIVPTDHPGMTRIRNIPVMGHAGEGYFSHSEVEFKDCRVPISNRLGPEGAGFIMAQDRLGPGRIHHCMRWMGICQRAQDELCSHAVTREVSEGRTLADKQIIQAWVAENAAEIEAARTMVLKAAWTVENEGWKAARDQIGLIKFYAAGVMQRVVDRALQAHGALGMTDDRILAFYYREERASRIYDGPDEVHKVSVAKRILRQYKNA